jgi:hypothetical protein
VSADNIQKKRTEKPEQEADKDDKKEPKGDMKDGMGQDWGWHCYCKGMGQDGMGWDGMGLDEMDWHENNRVACY